MHVADVDFLVIHSTGNLSFYYSFEILYNDVNISLRYRFSIPLIIFFKP